MGLLTWWDQFLKGPSWWLVFLLLLWCLLFSCGIYILILEMDKTQATSHENLQIMFNLSSYFEQHVKSPTEEVFKGSYVLPLMRTDQLEDTQQQIQTLRHLMGYQNWCESQKDLYTWNGNALVCTLNANECQTRSNEEYQKYRFNAYNQLVGDLDAEGDEEQKPWLRFFNQGCYNVSHEKFVYDKCEEWFGRPPSGSGDLLNNLIGTFDQLSQGDIDVQVGTKDQYQNPKLRGMLELATGNIYKNEGDKLYVPPVYTCIGARCRMGWSEDPNNDLYKTPTCRIPPQYCDYWGMDYVSGPSRDLVRRDGTLIARQVPLGDCQTTNLQQILELFVGDNVTRKGRALWEGTIGQCYGHKRASDRYQMLDYSVEERLQVEEDNGPSVSDCALQIGKFVAGGGGLVMDFGAAVANRQFNLFKDKCIGGLKSTLDGDLQQGLRSGISCYVSIKDFGGFYTQSAVMMKSLVTGVCSGALTQAVTGQNTGDYTDDIWLCGFLSDLPNDPGEALWYTLGYFTWEQEAYWNDFYDAFRYGDVSQMGDVMLTLVSLGFRGILEDKIFPLMLDPNAWEAVGVMSLQQISQINFKNVYQLVEQAGHKAAHTWGALVQGDTSQLLNPNLYLSAAILILCYSIGPVGIIHMTSVLALVGTVNAIIDNWDRVSDFFDQVGDTFSDLGNEINRTLDALADSSLPGTGGYTVGEITDAILGTFGFRAVQEIQMFSRRHVAQRRQRQRQLLHPQNSVLALTNSEISD